MLALEDCSDYRSASRLAMKQGTLEWEENRVFLVQRPAHEVREKDLLPHLRQKAAKYGKNKEKKLRSNGSIKIHREVLKTEGDLTY